MVWVCYGEQNCGKICVVCCDNNQMYDIKIQVDSRILCICYVQPDVIVVGTLAKNLHAFNKKTRSLVHYFDVRWPAEMSTVSIVICLDRLIQDED